MKGDDAGITYGGEIGVEVVVWGAGWGGPGVAAAWGGSWAGARAGGGAIRGAGTSGGYMEGEGEEAR